MSKPHWKTFRETAAVFSGKLVSIGEEKIFENNRRLFSLTFEIEKSWKGVKDKRITVLTNYPNRCSAFDFRENEKYLLYAYKLKDSDEQYVSSGCASSQELSSELAQKNIKDLDGFWFRLKSRFWIF